MLLLVPCGSADALTSCGAAASFCEGDRARIKHLGFEYAAETSLASDAFCGVMGKKRLSEQRIVHWQFALRSRVSAPTAQRKRTRHAGARARISQRTSA